MLVEIQRAYRRVRAVPFIRNNRLDNLLGIRATCDGTVDWSHGVCVSLVLVQAMLAHVRKVSQEKTRMILTQPFHPIGAAANTGEWLNSPLS